MAIPCRHCSYASVLGLTLICIVFWGEGGFSARCLKLSAFDWVESGHTLPTLPGILHAFGTKCGFCVTGARQSVILTDFEFV